MQYSYHAMAFQRWVELYAHDSFPVDAFPPSQLIVALWLSYEGQWISPESAKVYFFGLRDWLLKVSDQQPLALDELPLVKGVLKAMSLRRAQCEIVMAYPFRTTRKSITLDILLCMRPWLTGLEAPVLWAAWCLAVHLCLRIGEFTIRARGQLFLPWAAWRFGGALCMAQTLPSELTLRVSKTNLRAVNIRVFHSETPDCAVCAMAAYSKGVRGLAADPLFSTPGGVAPITREWMIARTRVYLEHIGLDGQRFSGISFRKGGALSLALAGVSDRLISVIGRWRSDCFRRYIESSDLELGRAVQVSSQFAMRQ